MIMSMVQTDIKKGPHSCRVTESWNLQPSIGCHQIRADLGALETQAAANTWKSFTRFPCRCSWLVASGHSTFKPRWPSNQFAVLSINQMRDCVMMLTIIAAITVQSLNLFHFTLTLVATLMLFMSCLGAFKQTFTSPFLHPVLPTKSSVLVVLAQAENDVWVWSFTKQKINKWKHLLWKKGMCFIYNK